MRNLNVLKTTAFIGAFAATSAFALEADPNIDVNGDGFYSYPEVTMIFEDITDEAFTVMDTTGDGLLDMAEVMAAQEAGLMPAME